MAWLTIANNILHHDLNLKNLLISCLGEHKLATLVVWILLIYLLRPML